jgi:hypothetical protein
MIDFDEVILDLERTRLRPQMYLEPVTPESLLTYLSGLERGIRLINQELTIDDYIDVRQSAIEAVGARRSAMHPLSQWRKENLEEKTIIEKLFELEIEYYRQLSVLQKQR